VNPIDDDVGGAKALIIRGTTDQQAVCGNPVQASTMPICSEL